MKPYNGKTEQIVEEWEREIFKAEIINEAKRERNRWRWRWWYLPALLSSFAVSDYVMKSVYFPTERADAADAAFVFLVLFWGVTGCVMGIRRLVIGVRRLRRR